MLPVWGDPIPGECGHGAPAGDCRVCRDQATRDYADAVTSPAALVALVVFLVALVLR